MMVLAELAVDPPCSLFTPPAAAGLLASVAAVEAALMPMTLAMTAATFWVDEGVVSSEDVGEAATCPTTDSSPLTAGVAAGDTSPVGTLCWSLTPPGAEPTALGLDPAALTGVSAGGTLAGGVAWFAEVSCGGLLETSGPVSPADVAGSTVAVDWPLSLASSVVRCPFPLAGEAFCGLVTAGFCSLFAVVGVSEATVCTGAVVPSADAGVLPTGFVVSCKGAAGVLVLETGRLPFMVMVTSALA